MSRWVHMSDRRFGNELHVIAVYDDGAATFVIAENGEVRSAVGLDPDEGTDNIAITDDVRSWLDAELAAGRAKAKGSAA